jgi:hypothetical protein
LLVIANWLMTAARELVPNLSEWAAARADIQLASTSGASRNTSWHQLRMSYARRDPSEV